MLIYYITKINNKFKAFRLLIFRLVVNRIRISPVIANVFIDYHLFMFVKFGDFSLNVVELEGNDITVEMNIKTMRIGTTVITMK